MKTSISRTAFLLIALGMIASCGILVKAKSEPENRGLLVSSPEPQSTFPQTEDASPQAEATKAPIKTLGGVEVKDVIRRPDGTIYYGANLPSHFDIKKISLTDSAVCALTGKGLVCWGSSSMISQIPTLQHPIDVAVGADHICVVDVVGGANKVLCWGSSTKGQLNIPELHNPSLLSAGEFHTCALEETKKITCWGDNKFGQLHSPTTTVSVTKIVSGDRYSCALDSGSVRCWGNQFRPGQSISIPPLENPTDLVSGKDQLCAKENGKAVCWSQEFDGTLSVQRYDTSTQTMGAGTKGTTCFYSNNKLNCDGRYINNKAADFPSAAQDVRQIEIGVTNACVVSKTGVDCFGGGQRAPSQIPSQRMSDHVAPVIKSFALTCPTDGLKQGKIGVKWSISDVDLASQEFSYRYVGEADWHTIAAAHEDIREIKAFIWEQQEQGFELKLTAKDFQGNASEATSNPCFSYSPEIELQAIETYGEHTIDPTKAIVIDVAGDIAPTVLFVEAYYGHPIKFVGAVDKLVAVFVSNISGESTVLGLASSTKLYRNIFNGSGHSDSGKWKDIYRNVKNLVGRTPGKYQDRYFGMHFTVSNPIRNVSEFQVFCAFAYGAANGKSIVVNVPKTDRPVYLILSSYSEINWQFKLAPGAIVAGVMHLGYDDSTFSNLPANTPIIEVEGGLSPRSGSESVMAYQERMSQYLIDMNILDHKLVVDAADLNCSLDEVTVFSPLDISNLRVAGIYGYTTKNDKAVKVYVKKSDRPVLLILKTYDGATWDLSFEAGAQIGGV
ncbi:MAG: hypothetical protein NTV34_15580, partial [Proteobacteria bacterium]|nr:hypothetical protein [Pseudomonadota bacterium]